MKCYIHNESKAIGVCVECGKPICESCNTEIKEKYYCKNCIERKIDNLGEKEEKTETKVTREHSNENYKPIKNKVVAGLLGILLGGFGIHKFYLGQIGLGIVYVLFCWTYIPAIIGFIEGIIYLCTDERSFAKKYDGK